MIGPIRSCEAGPRLSSKKRKERGTGERINSLTRGAAALAAFVVLAAELVLKLTIPQSPPPTELARTVPLFPFLEAPTVSSFPSGHMARVAFLVAVLRWPTDVSALVVFAMALTRVYLAEHWPSDVVGGWLLGYGIASAAFRRS